MAYLFSLLISLLYLLLKCIQATKTTVTVGQDIILPCHTNLSAAVDWMYQPTSTDAVQQLCMNGEIVAASRDRFSIISTRRGEYNLHIRNITMFDAGKYTCVEDAGLSSRHERELVVKPDSSPSFDNSYSTSALLATLKTNATGITSPTPAAVTPKRAEDVSTTLQTTTTTTTPPPQQQPLELHLTGTVNGTIILPCHTDLAVAVDWWYQPTAADKVVQVCMNGEIVVTFRNRFSITSNSSKSGDYSLLIKRLQLTDIGLYTCVEDAGLSTRHCVNLTVTANPDASSESHAGITTTAVSSGGDHIPSVFYIIIASVVAAVIVILVVVTWLLCRRRRNGNRKMTTDGEQELSHLNSPAGVENDNRVRWNAVLATPTKSVAPMTWCMKKCAAKLFISGMKKDPDADLAAVNTLASVCTSWWQILNDNKQQIKRTFRAVCHPYRRHLKTITTINTNGIVSTVACFGDKMYTVISSTKSVAVYQTCHPYDRLHEYRIDEIKQVTDMVAWESQRSLFLADNKEGNVWKLNAANDHYTKWLAGHQVPSALQDVKPCCLSVAQDQLVIAFSDCTVRSFGPNGKVLKRLDLDNKVNIFYTVAHPISGQVITFAKDYSKSIPAANKLRVFKHLFRLVFDEEGHAFSYGFREPNIYLRDAALRKYRIVLHDDREEKARLTGMCYMKSTGLLLIYESNLIRIYSVRRN